MQKPEMTLCCEWTREELQNCKSQTIFHKHLLFVFTRILLYSKEMHSSHSHSSQHALGNEKWIEFDSFIYIAFLDFVVMNSDLILTPFAREVQEVCIIEKRENNLLAFPFISMRLLRCWKTPQNAWLLPSLVINSCE